MWSLCDGILALAGWGLFGAAWGDVRNGCQRLAQIAIVLGLRIVAHYVGAICWPIVSLCFLDHRHCYDFDMGGSESCQNSWTDMHHLQKFLGGTPEAVDAEFCGPGTGKTPETAELRRFKASGTQDKWVVLKRGQGVAVFRLGSEAHTI